MKTKGDSMLFARTLALLRPLACATLLTACGVLSSGPEPAELDDFRAARARWEGQETKSYSYTLELHAMIIGGTPIAVEVRDGMAASVTYVDTGAPVATTAEGGFVARFDTVQELFRVIEDHLERGSARVVVAYDESHGYPVSAEIDPERGVVDDEFSFRVTRFERAR